MTGIVSTIQSTVLSKPPTAIIGSNVTTASTYNWSQRFTVANALGQSNIRTTLSGAMTAATYKEILAVTGSGVLNFAGVAAEDATSRDLYIKVLIDGVQVCERSMLTCVTAGSGVVCVGTLFYDGTTSSSLTFDQIPFASSLSIQIKSSLTETDKLLTLYHYRTN